MLRTLAPVLLGAVLVASGQQPTAQEPHTDDAAKLEPVHESITIAAEPLGPQVTPQMAEILNETLLSRDDQILQVLGAGISAGQHEGGGKSLEIRRFGFNLDHGGANGGLRITVDNVAQNYATQGHGQGYIGALKSLSPELIEDVNLISGPFRAEHGDFSGLGVVQIRTRESLEDIWTARFQGGSFDNARAFVAWSPELDRREALFAYDGSHNNGPFLRPLGYVRHNVTLNHTWLLGKEAHFGFKANGGTNRFNSSGQLPLDEVDQGRLDRFAALSPGDGGSVDQGRVAAYYRKDFRRGSGLRADAFVERSLFDLYSNFTFFLNDPVLGDAIQQHDSRLSQGGDVKYEKFMRYGWGSGTLSLGGSVVASQNLVDLRLAPNRNPIELLTSADARFVNGGGYAQQTVAVAGGKVMLTGGLRWDAFRFVTDDHLEPEFSRTATTYELQPKAAVSLTPWSQSAFQVFMNYGRGVASLDARGIARRPDSPRTSTTDFLQTGVQHTLLDRWSFQGNMFLIRQSNQSVYIPDDGTIELTDPSQSYGFEARSAMDLGSKVGWTFGLTKVLNAYFRDSSPRLYIDRAPRFTFDSALTLSRWRGWAGSLRMRAINHYRLTQDDGSIAAAGHTVFDLATSRQVSKRIELSLAVDNLLGREYWETQNYFESRLAGQQPRVRIHGTPAFGRTIIVGIRFQFREK